MKRKVKKKKIKIKNVILFLFILALIVIAIFFFSCIPVKGYYIKGNSYYTDDEILKMTELDKYPSFLFTNSYDVSKKIKNNKLIEKIKIKKNLFLEFDVIVYEKKMLFYDMKINKTILDDGQAIDIKNENIPSLINEVPDKKVYCKFLKKMKLINSDTMGIISEIKYDPNDIDKERFLVSMNDGNYVYLTLSKFSKINDYLKISKTLQGKNGILYLDYGNYFLSK